MPRIARASRGLTRRRFLRSSAGLAALGGGLLLPGAFPRPAIAQAGRPIVTHGVQAGDVGLDQAVVWSRADRSARLVVEWATSDSFRDVRRIVGPAALETRDFTAKLPLTGLPAGQDIFYRVQFQDLADINLLSEPAAGRFRTAPAGRRDVTFLWSGDTAGQGWGINLDWGGMRIYETMRSLAPDFFLHCGDTIYADGPLEAEKEQPDGGVWKNVMIEEKAKVAETLAEFRGNHKYNLMDTNVLAFNAEVPIFAQWDDHETTNNWYPQEMLAADERYSDKSAALLAARANRAFLEYMPVLENAVERERIYRQVAYGPHLDLFIIDMRSYRGPNSANLQETAGPETAFLGREQLRWLKQGLLASRATWKVIASDMPIGLLVPDGKDGDFENLANGDGLARGRELEMVELLRFIKLNGIKNTVWLTADVHYTAAHFYDPDKAQFQDFAPFWEFVSGPLNSGTFGPNPLDNTFGPQVMYVKAPPEGQSNLPPSAGLQFFGQVHIAGDSGIMTVTLKDLANADLWSVELTPEA